MLKNREISIKSTKNYGQLLLLETKDWNELGNYIPNKESGVYDFIMLIRLNPGCADLLKQSRLLYSDKAEYSELKTAIKREKWTYNYTGYISREELQYIINHKHIICKGELLNGKKPMDAENYYIQAGDLHSLESIKNFF